MIRHLLTLFSLLFVFGIAVYVATEWPRWAQSRALEEEATRQQENAEYLASSHPGDSLRIDRLADKVFVDESDAEDAEQSKSKGDDTPRTKHYPVPDAEWLKLPRMSFNVARYLTGPTKSISARKLFRHRELNPGDSYISSTYQREFSRFLNNAIARIDRVLLEETKMATREFSALIASGKAKTRQVSEVISGLTEKDKKRLARLEEILAAKARDLEAKAGIAQSLRNRNVVVPSLFFKDSTPYAYKSQNGTIYQAALRELPATRKAAELRSFLTMELVGKILFWFSKHAQCPIHTQEKIILGAQAILESVIR